jgi:hypothetical protein
VIINCPSPNKQVLLNTAFEECEMDFLIQPFNRDTQELARINDGSRSFWLERIPRNELLMLACYDYIPQSIGTYGMQIALKIGYDMKFRAIHRHDWNGFQITHFIYQDIMNETRLLVKKRQMDKWITEHGNDFANSIQEEEYIDVLHQLSIARDINLLHSQPPVEEEQENKLPPLMCLAPKKTMVEDETDCAICLDTFSWDKFSMFNCKHQFCVSCTFTCLQKNLFDMRCALCRSNVSIIYVQNSESYHELVPLVS